ncbi:shisa family member 2a [Brachyhypopomus gauderio]|uniref:shisa family member 2a n=1 Tax=Brachyhypopomus gauderio TaxID=698409 RepID=UPI004041A937
MNSDLRTRVMVPSTLVLCLWLPAAAPLVRAVTGEYCHAWLDSIDTRHRGFHCPERYDAEGARYCCGTCALRYCCASADTRLDQSTCDTELQDSDKTQKTKPSIPTYLPFVIVVSAFLSFTLLGAMVSIFCCQCVKPITTQRSSGPSPTQTSLLESGGPSPKSSAHSCSSTGASTGPRPPRPCLSEQSAYGAPAGPFPGQQAQAFAPTLHQGAGPFYQPYLSYPLPPEHTMLMGTAFLDGRVALGQLAQPFPQTPMHTEPIHSTVTI